MPFDPSNISDAETMFGENLGRERKGSNRNFLLDLLKMMSGVFEFTMDPKHGFMQKMISSIRGIQRSMGEGELSQEELQKVSIPLRNLAEKISKNLEGEEKRTFNKAIYDCLELENDDERHAVALQIMARAGKRLAGSEDPTLQRFAADLMNKVVKKELENIQLLQPGGEDADLLDQFCGLDRALQAGLEASRANNPDMGAVRGLILHGNRFNNHPYTVIENRINALAGDQLTLNNMQEIIREEGRKLVMQGFKQGMDSATSINDLESKSHSLSLMKRFAKLKGLKETQKVLTKQQADVQRELTAARATLQTAEQTAERARQQYNTATENFEFTKQLQVAVKEYGEAKNKVTKLEKKLEEVTQEANNNQQKLNGKLGKFKMKGRTAMTEAEQSFKFQREHKLAETRRNLASLQQNLVQQITLLENKRDTYDALRGNADTSEAQRQQAEVKYELLRQEVPRITQFKEANIADAHNNPFGARLDLEYLLKLQLAPTNPRDHNLVDAQAVHDVIPANDTDGNAINVIHLAELREAALRAGRNGSAQEAYIAVQETYQEILRRESQQLQQQTEQIVADSNRLLSQVESPAPRPVMPGVPGGGGP